MSRPKSYAKHQKEGHVPEEDGHFTVNFLPIIKGFICHAVKKTPAINPRQWVEVIHRNGERDYGPAECFAWGLMKCHPNDREDYHQFAAHGQRKPIFAYLDLEITHYRLVSEPDASWHAGLAFPSSPPLSQIDGGERQ